MIQALIYIEILAAAVVFVVLFFISAPYGRHVRKGWGPVVGARYAWMIMEFPAFFIIAALVCTHLKQAGWFGVFFLGMWEVHYAYRVFVYPFLLSTPKKPFPLLLVLFALGFNTINGLVNGGSLIDMGVSYAKHDWILDPRFLAGIALFASGFVIHVRSDALLRRLRKTGKQEYLVPDTGLFGAVTNPNYLGEIVEWTGWAIATWSLAGFAFMLFTMANLIPRAFSNHRWYRNEFPSYPTKRRILIPFVW
jgi:protein-S-isoprenylcysteine O-methyltransferase Ste14